MKYRPVRITMIVTLPILVIGYCLILYRTLNTAWNTPGERTWKVFYPVLVPNSPGAEETIEKIGAKFPVIGYEDISISFFNFSDSLLLPLDQIDSTFGILDTRLDRFSKTVQNYFFSKDRSYRIVYLKSDSSPLRLFFQLKQEVPGTGVLWFLPDVDLFYRVFFVAVFALIMILAPFKMKSNRISPFLVSLPWLPLLFFGPVELFFPASVFVSFLLSAIPYIAPVVKEKIHTGKIRYTRSVLFSALFLGMIGGGYIIYTFVSQPMPRPLAIPFLLGLGADCIVLLLFFFAAFLKYTKTFHPLFNYFPLGSKKKISISTVSLLAALFLSTAVLAIGLFPKEGSVSAEIPAPIDGTRIASSGLSCDELEALYNRTILRPLPLHSGENDRGLPSAADYVKHVFYQETWIFNGVYRFPAPGEVITVSTYTDKGPEGIEKILKPVLTADLRWFQSVLQNTTSQRFLSLVLSEEGFPLFGYKKIVQTGLKKRKIDIYYAVWFVLQLIGLFSYTPLTPITLYGMKTVEPRSRRRLS